MTELQTLKTVDAVKSDVEALSKRFDSFESQVSQLFQFGIEEFPKIKKEVTEDIQDVKSTAQAAADEAKKGYWTMLGIQIFLGILLLFLIFMVLSHLRKVENKIEKKTCL